MACLLCGVRHTKKPDRETKYHLTCGFRNPRHATQDTMNITLSRNDSRDSTTRRQTPAGSGLAGNRRSGGGDNRRQSVQSVQSVQTRLTEDTFGNYLDGFQQVTPEDLLDAKGGRVRYVIESVDSWGGASNAQYRLGGWLTKVDPALRYIRLVNPYAKRAWSVQLRPPGKRVRLYYMPPGTSDEVATMRNLLTQLESGRIRITRAP